MNAAQQALVAAVRIYQATISPVFTCVFGPLGLGCRFQPTCSQYALEAVRRHGALKGSVLAIRRIGRCHPWGGCGEDRVPEQFHLSALKLRSRDSVLECGSPPPLFNAGDTPKAPEDRRNPKPGEASSPLLQGEVPAKIARSR
jgi:hypothetical protein